MKTNIYFDFDMTLGYRIMLWTATVRQLLLEEAIIAKESQIVPFTQGTGYPWNHPEMSHDEFFGGKTWWQNTKDFIVSGLLNAKICNKKTALVVADKFPARFKDPAYWRLFPDTIPTLKQLKAQGYDLYIISNHVPEAREIISNLGITPYFTKMFLSAEIGWEKPNDNIFNYAKLHSRKADTYIMVGDNYLSDVVGACKNGFIPIFARENNSNNYEYYVKDFSSLAETISHIEKNKDNIKLKL